MTNREIAAQCAKEVLAAKRHAEMNVLPFTLGNATAVIAGVLDRCGVGMLLGEPAPKVKRSKAELDALFDALVAVQKGNVAQMTKTGRGDIAEARKQIMEASPDVTPDEISRRAKLYKSRWPTWHLSAMSLTKHWAELGPADPTLAARSDVYQEPQGDWKAAAIKVAGLSELPEAWANWGNIPVDWRAQILRQL